MIVACVKWVDLHPEIDPLTGAVATDGRRAGVSMADRAALELALTLGDLRGEQVTIVAVASADAEAALRELAACGASGIVRVDAPEPPSSASVGASIAATVAASGDVSLVLAGDMSPDGGSGSVPGFVAHHLDWAQALGCVEVRPTAAGLRAVRRLDGGRREVLSLAGPAVVSVEGAAAQLRRAPLSAVLATRTLPVVVVPPARSDAATAGPGPARPLRPRARALPAPSGDSARDRIVELTGALVDRTPPRHVTAEPEEAADVIVEQLREWGYLG